MHLIIFEHLEAQIWQIYQANFDHVAPVGFSVCTGLPKKAQDMSLDTFRLVTKLSLWIELPPNFLDVFCAFLYKIIIQN